MLTSKLMFHSQAAPAGRRENKEEALVQTWFVGGVGRIGDPVGRG